MSRSVQSDEYINLVRFLSLRNNNRENSFVRSSTRYFINWASDLGYELSTILRSLASFGVITLWVKASSRKSACLVRLSVDRQSQTLGDFIARRGETFALTFILLRVFVYFSLLFFHKVRVLIRMIGLLMILSLHHPNHPNKFCHLQKLTR